MQDDKTPPPGPDLAIGVPREQVPENGMLVGHVGTETVLLTRLDDGMFAVSATCTHYGGPLAEGRMVDGEIHCPWHHACFSLRTGQATAAPAFAPLQCWNVEVVDGHARVQARDTDTEESAKSPTTAASVPAARREQRIVVIGGGAAGFAAVDRLRKSGFDGALIVLSADADAPYDRPNRPWEPR